MTGDVIILFQIIKVFIGIVILLLLVRQTRSDHENLTEHHYRPGAPNLPVDRRYMFNSSSLASPSPLGSGTFKFGEGKISYMTIACYPTQEIVRNDTLLCEDGCKVTDEDEDDCGPNFYKLYCDCTDSEEETTTQADDDADR